MPISGHGFGRGLAMKVEPLAVRVGHDLQGLDVVRREADELRRARLDRAKHRVRALGQRQAVRRALERAEHARRAVGVTLLEAAAPRRDHAVEVLELARAEEALDQVDVRRGAERRQPAAAAAALLDGWARVEEAQQLLRQPRIARLVAPAVEPARPVDIVRSEAG